MGPAVALVSLFLGINRLQFELKIVEKELNLGKDAPQCITYSLLFLKVLNPSQSECQLFLIVSTQLLFA